MVPKKIADGPPGFGDTRLLALIVTGAQDRRFLDAATYMADKIPGATTDTIENAGHLPNIEQPAAFNRHLLDFLAAL